MKQKVFTMVAGILMIFGTVGSAMAVTFDEVPLYTPDPLIDGVQFFAGDPMLWNDTYVDDAWSPGNPYLASGYDDGTGSSPGLYDTFIGASAQGFSFDSVALNIASEMWLPPNGGMLDFGSDR